MKALICPSLGPVENLLITDVAAPAAGDGEVLVEIAYAGLNFFDTLLIEGKYQVRPSRHSRPAPSFPARARARTWSARFRGRRSGYGLVLLWGRCGADRRGGRSAYEDPERSRS